MPIVFELILSLLIAFGFYYIGEFIVLKLRLTEVIKIVSNPHYQYFIIGIAFFLYILFPIFLLGLFNKFIFLSIFYTVSIFGCIKLFFNFKIICNAVDNFFKKIKNNSKIDFLVFFLIILYLCLSLSPPTSGDTLFYHLSHAKKILLTNSLYSEELDFHAKLAGLGEFLNAFAISVNAYQFTTLIHFMGLVSTIGVIKGFSKNIDLENKDTNFAIFILLSSPILISLISQSKPQLLYSSLVFFCYSFLISILLLKINLNKKKLFKIIFLTNICLIVSVNAKFNFMLSLGIINLFYFFYLIKKKYKINLKTIIYFILLILFGIFPFIIWKSLVYNYPFYFFLLNPLPLNIPHIIDFYDFLKNYNSQAFPLSFIIPKNIGEITNSIGLGFFLLFFLISIKFHNKKIILLIIFFYICMMSFFGQKTPRFYYEIYLFIILVFLFIINSLKQNFYLILYKILVSVQIIFVTMALIWSVIFLFPGSILENQKYKVQSKFADGFTFITWANSVIPKDEIILITHRSTFFFKNKYINPEPLGYMKFDSIYKNFYLDKIKQKKPTLILFHGNKISFNIGEFDFKNCIDSLYKMKLNVGKLTTRNPLNKNQNFYNGYIYRLNYKKLPSCVTNASIK